jgi:hypothetical protein
MSVLSRTSQMTTERGAVAVITALLLPALLGVAGLVIDGGELLLARLRLQTAADSAALAAASFIGRSRSGNHSSLAGPVTGSLDAVAWPILQRNWRTDAPLTLTVESGRWDAAARRLVPSPDRPDAVAVHVSSTPPTRLAGALGVRRWTVSAHSVAALPPLGSVPAGTVTLPLGLASLSTGGSLLNGYATGQARDSGPCTVRLSFESQDRPGATPRDGFPALRAGHSRIQVIGDGRSVTRQEIARSYRQPGASLHDDLTAVVPVIEADRCPVPPGWYRVAGFATVLVSAARSHSPRALPVTAAAHLGDPAGSLAIQLVIGHIAQGRGSGPDFGTKATASVLVQ